MRKKLSRDNLCVLVVDDVKSMRSIIRSMLKNLKIGRILHMAENGLEALKILQTSLVDIAIVDWKMPVMSGAELLEAIRNDRSLRDIPVIMVTAESQKDIVLEVAEIEVEGYLLKPLTPAVLESKILQIIEQVNHPDEATLHVRKAKQLEEKNDIETAIKHMIRAVELKPGASRLLRNLGLLYGKAGNVETMLRYLKQAVSANDQDAVTRQILGEYYWEKDDLISALNCYIDVVDLTRKYNERAVDLGRALLEQQQARNARLLFSRLIARTPKDTALVERIVNVCSEHQEYDYALELLKKLIHSFPSNYDLMYQAGCLCLKMDNSGDALEYFMQVDNHQANRFEVKLKIAKILIFNKKIIQADNYLNQVLKKDPKNKLALELRRLI